MISPDTLVAIAAIVLWFLLVMTVFTFVTGAKARGIISAVFFALVMLALKMTR